MSDAGPTTRPTLWQRVEWLPLLYLVLMLLLCVTAAWRPFSAASDFWGLAAVGRWICTNGDVPRETLFLWSASEPWVAHSWLTQVVFYGLTLVGNEETVTRVALAFTALFVALPYLLVWRLWRQHGHISSWILLPFSLAIIANFHRYQTRSELFTALLLVWLLTFLTRWAGTSAFAPWDPARQRSWLGPVFLLASFTLWANLHGAVVVGLAVLGVTAVCDLAQDRGGRRAWILVVLAGLAPLAVCVNPYGFRYWSVFESVNSFRWARISECAPPWAAPAVPGAELAVLGLLLALALLAWLLSERRRWAHLAWLVVFAALFANARRNCWLMTLGSLTVLAIYHQSLTPDRLLLRFGRQQRQRSAIPPALRWVVRVWLISWVSLKIAVRVYALQASNLPARPVHLETGALAFFKEHGLNGRVFNDFETSPYLQWHLADVTPLFTDIHLAYPDDVTRHYLQIVQVTPRGRRLLEELKIDAIVLVLHRPGPSLEPLARFLDRGANWKRVYSGTDAVIWLRQAPQHASLLANVGNNVATTPFARLLQLHSNFRDAHTHFDPF